MRQLPHSKGSSSARLGGTWPWGPNHYQLVRPDLIITSKLEREKRMRACLCEACAHHGFTRTVEPRERKQSGKSLFFLPLLSTSGDVLCYHTYQLLPPASMEYTTTHAHGAKAGPVLMLPSSLPPRTLSCSLSHAMPAACSKLTTTQTQASSISSNHLC
jgi:hypothetical protein